MRSPRTKPGAIRREELLDAAQRMMLVHGVAATSVEQIAVAAQVAKGTFYLHFATKDHLIAALQQRYVESFCDEVQRAMDRCATDDWAGRLRAWVHAAIAAYVSRAALHDLVFLEPQHVSARRSHRGDGRRAPQRKHDTRGKQDNAIVDQLAALLSRGTTAQAWLTEQPAATAVMLFSALHGAVDHALGDGKLSDAQRKRLVRTTETFFVRALTETP